MIFFSFFSSQARKSGPPGRLNEKSIVDADVPLYEYQCQDDKCGATTEKLRRMSEMDKPCPCEKCGKETKKKVSPTSFSLKGGGWADDGYGN